jgi:hypothetical protein
MVILLKDPKTPRHHNNFSNVAEYKINLQKSVAFLYTDNEQIEKEFVFLKTNSIYNSLKKLKYLGINLTKDVIDL